MVIDLLMYRGIPRQLSLEFAETTPISEYRRLIEAPLVKDHSIQAWASKNFKFLEGEELIAGVALVLSRIDPGYTRDMGSYASAFIDRYPAVTSRMGLSFWSTTIHQYQQLSAAGKEDLIILTRVKERDSLRTTRRDIVLQLRTKLLENQLFNGESGEARLHEFIGRNLVGNPGLNRGQDWLSSGKTLEEALQKYQADHYESPGSAFAALSAENPDPMAYPFWTCPGGCVTAIVSGNSRLWSWMLSGQ
jgi:hypothetical protein